MKQINFGKFHGFGNDYIVFEAQDLVDVSSLENFAERACQRHTGIGGDGIAVLEKSENGAADYSCRIVNPDGSEANFSGNGTRCAVAYLHYKKLWAAENLKLETRSGIKNYQLLKREQNTFWFLAELGKPKFDLPQTSFPQARLDESSAAPANLKRNIMIPGEGIAVAFDFVDVGNPVAVIFADDFSRIDWRRIGSLIENFTALFPERTNVVFVKVFDRKNIEIRIWERGAGETSSSGTCSVAAAIASASTGQTERQVSVHAVGGTTEVVWREDGEMLITGRADLAFCGEWTENI
jgi:diaminopimelate epimerase